MNIWIPWWCIPVYQNTRTRISVAWGMYIYLHARRLFGFNVVVSVPDLLSNYYTANVSRSVCLGRQLRANIVEPHRLRPSNSGPCIVKRDLYTWKETDQRDQHTWKETHERDLVIREFVIHEDILLGSILCIIRIVHNARGCLGPWLVVGCRVVPHIDLPQGLRGCIL